MARLSGRVIAHPSRAGLAWGVMDAVWRWDLLDGDGHVLAVDKTLASPSFPTQSEAESWVGEVWPALVDAGVDAVTLREGDGVVYGPMSLRPAQ